MRRNRVPGPREPCQYPGMEIRRVTRWADVEAAGHLLWLVTDEDNAAALTTYRRAGGVPENRQVVFQRTFGGESPRSTS